jgi:hypothetical protein
MLVVRDVIWLLIALWLQQGMNIDDGRIMVVIRVVVEKRVHSNESTNCYEQFIDRRDNC